MVNDFLSSQRSVFVGIEEVSHKLLMRHFFMIFKQSELSYYVLTRCIHSMLNSWIEGWCKFREESSWQLDTSVVSTHKGKTVDRNLKPRLPKHSVIILKCLLYWSGKECCYNSTSDS